MLSISIKSSLHPFIFCKHEIKESSIHNTHNKQVSPKLFKNDVIIVGAGVAGSALAHTLAKDGRNVLLLEKNLTQPKAFTGEILQPSGYLKLRELGLDDCVREIDAQPVLGYAIHKDGKSVTLSYPLENYEADVAGRSFHHGRFVQKLRDKAFSLSNVKLVEGTATSLVEEKGKVKGVIYKHPNGEEITALARLTVLCDGRFSRFNKFLASPEIEKPSHFAGFIIENCKMKDPNFPRIILSNPCVLLFFPISNTEIRCLVDFPGPKLPFASNAQLAEFLKVTMAPQVPLELRDAFVSTIERGNIKAMPISCMPANPRIVPGAILLGDSLNMRHAVTGSGMSVALHDITVLSSLLRQPLDLNDADKVTRYTKMFYSLRKPAAFTVNVLADALYKVILGSTDESRDQILEANFDYMRLDFGLTKSLSELISGLNSNPWNLIKHFIAMAVYTAFKLTKPNPTPERVHRAARFLQDATGLVVPLILKEGLRQVFFANYVRPNSSIGSKIPAFYYDGEMNKKK